MNMNDTDDIKDLVIDEPDNLHNTEESETKNPDNVQDAEETDTPENLSETEDNQETPAIENELAVPELSYVSKIIEGCLLTATIPVTLEQLVNIFDKSIAKNLILQIIDALEIKYADSAIELLKLANGYRFRSRLELQPYINKLYSIKPPRYSRSVMEILAIIAYKQPVTRGDIEEIRGVSVNSNVIQLLSERGWIEVIGHKQLPGKPELLATTNKLLEDLGISSLEDLPPLVTETPEAADDLIEEYHQKEEADIAQIAAEDTEATQEDAPVEDSSEINYVAANEEEINE